MTYKFKLSARLALLRSSAPLWTLTVLACTGGDMDSLSPYAGLNAARAATGGGTGGGNGRRTQQFSISPTGVSVGFGQAAQFAASSDKGASIKPTDLGWSAEGGRIDSLGRYIAGSTPGTYSVWASYASTGVADTVKVTVMDSALIHHIVRLMLAPTPVVLMTGDARQFVATAQFDDSVVQPVSALFTATGGSVTSAGQYTAGTTPGSYVVTAKTKDGYSATAAVSITAPVSVTSPISSLTTTAQPLPAGNEPAGYTRFGDLRFPSSISATSSVASLGCGGTEPVVAGCWWRYGLDEAIKQDGTAPISPNVFDIVFPAGLQPGYGDDQFGGWADATAPKQYREVYESGWFKIPSADFETQLVGVKLWGYWGVGAVTDNASQVYMVMGGNGLQTSVMSSWNINFGLQGTAETRWMSQNLNLTTKIRANVWHHYEMVMKLNDTGVRNGRMQVWLDGVQVLSYSDILFRDAAHPAGFFGRKWHPIWGGQGGTAKTRTDHLWVNQVYLSGIGM